jgi:hypothetical protein
MAQAVIGICVVTLIPSRTERKYLYGIYTSQTHWDAYVAPMRWATLDLGRPL